MKTKGFTIVETLIAIAILLILIAAPLTLAERSLASSSAAEQEVTAVYLAQEAIEFVRNLRDTNALAGTNWLTGLAVCEGGSGCGIDPTASAGNQIIDCSGADNPCGLFLNISQAGGEPGPLFGLFGHGRSGSDWVKSPYTRTVFLTSNSTGPGEKVAVTVNWVAGGFGTRTVTLSTNLMNWYVAP